jgi:hypothetical protein
MKKRHLAAPFVLTAMLSGPALADNTPPKQPPQTKKLPKAPDRSRVRRDPDGRCFYHEPENCPEGARCNPPPPMEVECPPEKPRNPPRPIPPT